MCTLPIEPTPRRLADAIRVLTIDAIERAGTGHPGMPMGMADVAVALFGSALRVDPAMPDWPDRDRLVLSAGHGSMLLYAALHLLGFPAFDKAALKSFRTWEAVTAGHPEIDQSLGVEMTTGPLGQGLATAVGMALAERMMNARFGDDLVDHRTYVIASDGDLMEGVSHEACSLAGHLCLNRLIVLFDDNDITIDGPACLACSDDVTGRFLSYGWHVESVDGHDANAVSAVLLRAALAQKPTLVRCRTIIGQGAPTMAGDAASHSGALGPEEISGTKQALDWTAEPFEIPADLAKAWRSFSERGSSARHNWSDRLDACDPERRKRFLRALEGELPDDLGSIVATCKQTEASCKTPGPTRVASGRVLGQLAQAIPALCGGSADLTPANNTFIDGWQAVSREDFSGRYIHFGVREHAMATIMNGLALHRGFIPYGGSFLVFTDYARPAIRLAALMKQQVIYVMTHDSIGLGPDGPTHQPVEHLASLRAMPGLRVFRPADGVEVAECWELALNYRTGPSIIVLSRQDVPVLRQDAQATNRSASGAYELVKPGCSHQATLLATGTEVSLALNARCLLEEQGIGTRVVSVPCWEIFDEQTDDHYLSLLDDDAVKIAVEAGSPLGWDRYIGSNGGVIGVSRFGASAPGEVIYEKLGLTATAIVSMVERLLKGGTRPTRRPLSLSSSDASRYL